jgi:AcrR family transcriptional regulator
MTERRTNEERSRQTRAVLVQAARRLFEVKGFAGTSIEEVVREAGVTRGALYHHFPTKLALFDAVIVQTQADLAELVDQAGAAATDPWDRFVAGWLAFIEVAPEAGIRRLMLEAPTVLGQRRWQEIDDEHALGIVAHGLEWLDERGLLAVEATPMLARVLLTVSNALGTLVAQADDPLVARAEVSPIWERLLRSLGPDEPASGDS